jgi:hypothetical protein
MSYLDRESRFPYFNPADYTGDFSFSIGGPKSGAVAEKAPEPAKEAVTKDLYYHDETREIIEVTELTDNLQLITPEGEFNGKRGDFLAVAPAVGTKRILTRRKLEGDYTPFELDLRRFYIRNHFTLIEGVEFTSGKVVLTNPADHEDGVAIYDSIHSAERAFAAQAPKDFPFTTVWLDKE